MRSFLLLKRMCFYLVDRRFYFAEMEQIQPPVRIKVAHADGTRFSGAHCLLHGAVCAVVVAEGLVDVDQ